MFTATTTSRDTGPRTTSRTTTQPTNSPTTQLKRSAANRLRTTMAAVRLSFTWLGARCIYDEALDLREIGTLKITRASHVEPDAEGYEWADMGPVGGPVLGPFRNRTEALEWLLGQDK